MGENYLALTKRESSILTLLLRSIKMKKKTAFLSLFASSVLTFWTLSTFGNLHWNFPCHKYLVVTYIKTRDDYENKIVIKDL